MTVGAHIRKDMNMTSLVQALRNIFLVVFPADVILFAVNIGCFFAARHCKLSSKATTECRPTFNHLPNEPARFNSSAVTVEKFVSVEFIYVVCRLARQGTVDERARNKLYGV